MEAVERPEGAVTPEWAGPVIWGLIAALATAIACCEDVPEEARGYAAAVAAVEVIAVLMAIVTLV